MPRSSLMHVGPQQLLGFCCLVLYVGAESDAAMPDLGLGWVPFSESVFGGGFFRRYPVKMQPRAVSVFIPQQNIPKYFDKALPLCSSEILTS